MFPPIEYLLPPVIYHVPYPPGYHPFLFPTPSIACVNKNQKPWGAVGAKRRRDTRGSGARGGAAGVGSERVVMASSLWEPGVIG